MRHGIDGSLEEDGEVFDETAMMFGCRLRYGTGYQEQQLESMHWRSNRCISDDWAGECGHRDDMRIVQEKRCRRLQMTRRIGRTRR